MKLVIEVFLRNTPEMHALAKKVRVVAGIYEAPEWRRSVLAEKARDARAELAGRPIRKKNFLKPNAIPNRRLMANTKTDLLELVDLLGAHMVDPEKAGLLDEIGKSCGGD